MNALPEAKRFLKTLLPARGGYDNKFGEPLDLVWKRGAPPVFQIVDSRTDSVKSTVSLEGMKVTDIESLLAKHGYSPFRNTVDSISGSGLGIGPGSRSGSPPDWGPGGSRQGMPGRVSRPLEQLA